MAPPSAIFSMQEFGNILVNPSFVLIQMSNHSLRSGIYNHPKMYHFFLLSCQDDNQKSAVCHKSSEFFFGRVLEDAPYKVSILFFIFGERI